MADLVQNAALVAKYSGVNPNIIPNQVSGEAINAGMPCYQSNDTNGTNVGRWFKASSANGLASGGMGPIVRIAMASAPGAGQPLSLMGAGRINLGGTILEPGETYVVSGNAGAIKPIGDLTNGEYTCILGTAFNNAALTIPPGGPISSNVARQSNVT